MASLLDYFPLSSTNTQLKFLGDQLPKLEERDRRLLFVPGGGNFEYVITPFVLQIV